MEQTPNRDDISILDYVSVLSRWRYFIAAIVLGIGLLTAAVTLMIPNRYKSTARLLPPSRSGGIGSMSQIARDLLPLAGLTGLQTSRESQNYLAILQSYTATKALVEEFRLAEVYDVRDHSLERAMKEARNAVEFTIEQEGTIAVTVWDVDPQRSSAMANFLVETLNQISIDLATREARNNREFLEKRVAVTKAALAEKEDSLKAYQEETGTLYLSDEGGSGLSAVAELYAMKAVAEIELGVLEGMLSPNSPAIAQKKAQLRVLQQQISVIPATGLQSLRLLRDVMIHQKILEFIIPLYEQARIDEQKEVPVILVLDKAVPAELKDTPKRTIIVLAAAMFALIVSILTVLFFEAVVHWKARSSSEPGRFVSGLKRVFRVDA